MHSRARYDDDDGPPVGVSLLLFALGVVALCIAAVYLQASTLHEREIKISAYEETIAAWTSFRPTFARLSVNVTAHFGVAPTNTTTPGMDPNPPPPGTSLSLDFSEDADPIYDEEGDAGGLPNYEPLKLERGAAPPPWRTARRFPPPEEDQDGEDEEEPSAEASEESSQEDAGVGGEETESGEQDIASGSSSSSDGGERRRRLDGNEPGMDVFSTPERDHAAVAAAVPAMAAVPATVEATKPRTTEAELAAASQPTPSLSSRSVFAGDAINSAGDSGKKFIPNGGIAGDRHARRADVQGEETGGTRERGPDQWSGQKQEQPHRRRKMEDEGEEEEEDPTEAAEETPETLPPDFIPETAFDGAPSVRFVFSARLEPPPLGGKNRNRNRRKNNNKRQNKHKDEGSDEGGRAKTRRALEGGEGRRWRRRRSDTNGGRQAVVAEMETEWTPLTRVREEHAPMPAPETKCMQVFGGVHNYKTKMCEVYERLSQICVQVHVDEKQGEIRFAPVPEIGSGSSNSSSSSSSNSNSGGGNAGEEEEEEEEEQEDAVARYGCDPRNAWSPWSYAVLNVDGRTAQDVIPPPAVSFVETFVSVRSDLDPFLHVEALTYVPAGGGGGGGTGEDSGGASGGGGGEPLAGAEAGAGAGTGGQFLTFGLSSRNCVIVGSAFLVVGLLLLAQPVLAMRRWCREARDEDGTGGGGGGGGSRRGRGRGRRGQWRYGQLETEWAEDGSDYSDDAGFEGDYRRHGDGNDDDDWGTEGDWHGQQTSSSAGMPPSPSEGDGLNATARSPSGGPAGRSFAQDTLRRRAGDGGALGGGGGQIGEAGGIQLGPMGGRGGGGSETAAFI